MQQYEGRESELLTMLRQAEAKAEAEAEGATEDRDETPGEQLFISVS